RFNNRSRADDNIAQLIGRWEVQHGSLARSNPRKRLAELQNHGVSRAVNLRVAGNDGTVRTDLHIAFKFAFHRWVKVLQAIGSNFGDLQIFPRTNGDGTSLGVDACDIARATIGSWGFDIQAFALADGVVPRAIVLTQLSASLVRNHAWAHTDARTQDCLGVAIRDETDVIGIWL